MASTTPDITTATSGDDVLTALYSIACEHRRQQLLNVSTRLLREAADLCGVDAADLGKRAAIDAILANF